MAEVRFGVLLIAAGLVIVGSLAAGCTSARPMEAGAITASRAEGGDWFVETGCTACHPVTAYGLWSPANKAPDLSVAVEDVPKRFGTSMEEFLHQPSGTMAVVLNSRIRLDEAGLQTAIGRLHDAYALHRQRSGSRH